ncbi:MAG: hypothetical protein IPG53_12995 [Ignavibacteriales bacterium]|nr:hypothetical protein [Ignavibacteriales bacterium]
MVTCNCKTAIENVKIELFVCREEDKLFGSNTSQMIAEGLKEKDLIWTKINRSFLIQSEPRHLMMYSSTTPYSYRKDKSVCS